MIAEKMLELLLLNEVIRNSDFKDMKDDGTIFQNGKTFNVMALFKRTEELVTEFTQPYVIDNAPKGD